jgi:hypothetical protein
MLRRSAFATTPTSTGRKTRIRIGFMIQSRRQAGSMRKIGAAEAGRVTPFVNRLTHG